MGRLIYGSTLGNHPNIYMTVSKNIIRVIEYASRICYDATDKTTESSWKKYIQARVNSGHESVIEHGCVSFIVDFSECSDYESCQNITDIESFLSRSNSLLHYVLESGWNSENTKKYIMILSGNLKMWRDFFKWINLNHPSDKCETILSIMKMFVYFDYVSCDGIFTSDIPGMHYGTKAVHNGSLLNTGSNSRFLSGSFIGNWDSVPLISEENMIPIFVDKPDDELSMRWDLISVDNVGIEFLNVTNFMPLYVNLFIQHHVLDLNSVTFKVHTPRVVTQQECRHRINSISQRSQRYVNESSKDTKFYCPESIDPDKVYTFNIDGVEIKISYNILNKVSASLYGEMLKDGIKKEDARNILTNGIFSDMVITKPLYTLPHYFKERCSDAAQAEMRFPARALRDLLNMKFKYAVPDGKNLF